MVTAESCSGGRIAAAVTAVPGASDVFWGGFVTYSNEAKRSILGVPASTLTEHGAVSEPTVLSMAEGAIRASGADVAVAVSGIAGPGGGSTEKPVGTVWLAIATKTGWRMSKRLGLSGDRERIMDETARIAVEETIIALERDDRP